MDNSVKYKNMCNNAEEIQKLWTPKDGDFWVCSCDNFINEKRLNIIEHTDVLVFKKISEIYSKEKPQSNNSLLKLAHEVGVEKNYCSNLVYNYHTSLDCGFGSFWIEYIANSKRNFVWLPRIDQLINIYLYLSNEKLPVNIIHELDKFLRYYQEYAMNDNIEVFLLRLIMEKFYNKKWEVDVWEDFLSFS